MQDTRKEFTVAITKNTQCFSNYQFYQKLILCPTNSSTNNNDSLSDYDNFTHIEDK